MFNINVIWRALKLIVSKCIHVHTQTELLYCVYCKPLKVLWFCAVVFGGGMAAYQLTNLLIKYFGYPSNTKLKEVNEAPELPDITLCNLNPLTDHLTSYVAPDHYSKGLMGFAMATMMEENGETNEYNYFKQALPKYSLTNEEIDDVSSTVFSPSGFFRSLPYDGVQFDIESFRQLLFRDCVFYSWDMTTLDLKCDNNTVSHFFFPEHFMCFIISVPDVYKFKVKGISSVLYLDQDTHATYPIFKLNMLHHKSNGMRVVVHARHSLPSLTDGDSIPPGHETTVRLFPIDVELLPEPYGEYVDKIYLEFDDDYKYDGVGRPPYLYTSDSCHAICYQEYVIKTCGCVDLLYSYSEKQLKEHMGLPFCGNTTFIQMKDNQIVLNIDEAQMLAGFTSNLCALRARVSAEILNCSCSKGCRYKEYRKSFSQTPRPGVDYQIRFFDNYIAGTSKVGHF